jgi:hypothetical protein
MENEVKDIVVQVDTSKYDREISELKEMIQKITKGSEEKKSELKGEVPSSTQPSLDWQGYVLEESGKTGALWNIDNTKNPKLKRLSRL